MTKLNIKKGDNVVVISGKDKKHSGKVLEVFTEEKRVIVEGANIVTKHQKPRSAQDKGGIVKQPAPIDISKVMVVCPSCGKATRVSKQEIEGKHVRVCKKCGASLDKAYVKAVKKSAKKKETAKETKAKDAAVEVKKEKTTSKAKTVTTKKPENEKMKKTTNTKTNTSSVRRSANRGV